MDGKSGQEAERIKGLRDKPRKEDGHFKDWPKGFVVNMVICYPEVRPETKTKISQNSNKRPQILVTIRTNIVFF